MLSRLLEQADANRGVALDLIRIYLGIGLFVRGLVFLSDIDAYFALAGASGEAFGSVALAHYVAVAHVIGGLLLAGGLLTRAAALAQIPVLAGAVFVIHFPDSLLTADQSFAFSALVLALLTVFAIWGGGRWSLDRAVGKWVARDEKKEAALAEAHIAELRERERQRPPAPPREAIAGIAGGQEEPACSCGHEPGAHPNATAEREYGTFSRLRFVFGTHPRPAQVTIRCADCDGVVEVVTDPERLERYRFDRTAA